MCYAHKIKYLPNFTIGGNATNPSEAFQQLRAFLDCLYIKFEKKRSKTAQKVLSTKSKFIDQE